VPIRPTERPPEAQLVILFNAIRREPARRLSGALKRPGLTRQQAGAERTPGFLAGVSARMADLGNLIRAAAKDREV
jgi:hypothetical protein